MRKSRYKQSRLIELHVEHPSRDSMQMDVEKYIKYYNYERLHTTLNDMSPIEFESVKEKCAA